MLDKNVELEIECGKCGHNFKKTILDIEREPTFSCPQCGLCEFKADELLKGWAGAERALREFGKNISKDININP